MIESVKRDDSTRSSLVDPLMRVSLLEFILERNGICFLVFDSEERVLFQHIPHTTTLVCLEDVASIINAEQVRKIRRYTTMEGNEEFEVTFHDTFNEVSLFRLRRYPGWFFLEILLTGVSPLPKAGDEDGQTEQEMHQLQRAQALLNEIKAFEVPTEENKQKRDRIVTYFVPELERLQLEIKDPLTNKCLNIIRQNLEDVADSSGAMNKLYKVLTPSEIKVAEFIRMGMSSKDIANTLEIAQKTVDNHRNSLRDKLGLKNKGMNLRSYLMQIEEN